jgi:hypothetical protein
MEEMVCIKNLRKELGIMIDPTIQVDNQPAIDTMINQNMIKGNKRIMNCYYFFKDYYQEGNLPVPKDNSATMTHHKYMYKS